MDPDPLSEKRKQLELAIAAQESLRGTLEDSIVDATIAALRQQLEGLRDEDKAQKRKLMSVLFVDIVDSTQMMEHLDPEESLAIMDRSLRALAEPVVRRGGRVLRFMGDGFLAVFGLAQAQENDPESAVRTGLDMVVGANSIQEQLREEKGIEAFQIRVGINTGLVVAGGETEGGNTIMGPAVNLAARLESSAPENGILISQHTYQHVQGIFEVEKGNFLQAKGFAEPVMVYRVIRAVPRRVGLRTRGVEGVETHMVGRAEELEALQLAFEKVMAGMGAELIMVVGEAGMGKSRLLAEFERWLAEELPPFSKMEARATVETRNTPHGLLREMMTHALGLLGNEPTVVVRQKVERGFEQMLGKSTATVRKSHLVGHLMGFDFHDSEHLAGILDDPRLVKDLAANSLLDYFEAMESQKGLVFFLDDLHWSDGSSLEILMGLFQKLSEMQVFIVALARPDFFETQQSWGLGFKRKRIIRLQPLTNEHSRQLVDEMLAKVRELPAALRDRIIKQAEGNPFYLEELIKMLIEDGVILKGEPAWRVDQEKSTRLRIPATLTGVLQARIESLPEEERDVLQQASVIGRAFWFEAVCFLSQNRKQSEGQAKPADVDIRGRLEMLQKRELIYPQPDSSFAETLEFLFKHAVLREVTYENVLKSLRQVYHSMAARWLMEHSADRVDEVSGLIAGHLEKAGETAEAVVYLTRAAKIAGKNYALAEAEGLYSRAMSLVDPADLETRFTLHHGRADIYYRQGNRTAQKSDLEDLTAIAGSLDDPIKSGQTNLDWAWYWYFSGDFEKSREVVQAAIEEIEGNELTTISAKLHDAFAWTCMQLREFELAKFHAQKALEFAVLAEDAKTKGHNLITLSTILSLSGEYGVARDTYIKALDFHGQHGMEYMEPNILLNFSVTLIMMGDYETAARHLLKAIETVHERKDLSNELVGLINLGWALTSQENWEEALKYLMPGLALARNAEQVEAAAECLLWIGHCYAATGQFEKALEVYRESLDYRIMLEQPDLEMGVRAGLARLALNQGDLREALLQVERILGFLEDGGSLEAVWEPLRLYWTCVQVLDRVGDQRKGAIFREAYEMLQARAGRFKDPKDRQRYLENVPWHREIMAGRAARGS